MPRRLKIFTPPMFHAPERFYSVLNNRVLEKDA
jgi:hypothetical protein